LSPRRQPPRAGKERRGNLGCDRQRRRAARATTSHCAVCDILLLLLTDGIAPYSCERADAESADDSSFHARHAVLEKAERKANKSVYCTAQYRQAVDRARQRQKEEEKARDRLLPGSGPAPSPRAEEIDDSQAIETEAAKRNTGSRKRSRSGRGSVDAERDAKRAQRQELCRRYLYQQSTMSAEELEAARRAMVELRAEHNSPAARAQGTSPRRSGSVRLPGNPNGERSSGSKRSECA